MSGPSIKIRKQLPGMTRTGEPLKWIAVCQHCGNACAGKVWRIAFDWGFDHTFGCRYTRRTNRCP